MLHMIPNEKIRYSREVSTDLCKQLGLDPGHVQSIVVEYLPQLPVKVTVELVIFEKDEEALDLDLNYCDVEVSDEVGKLQSATD